MAAVWLPSSVANLGRNHRLALTTVAAIPLIFGFHQLSEGMVWVDMEENDVAVACFAYTAYSVWPFYIALVFTLCEWTRPVIGMAGESTQPRPEQAASKSWDTCWQHCRLSVSVRKYILVFNTILGAVLLIAAVESLHDQEPLSVEEKQGRLEYTGWGFTDAFSDLGTVAYVYTVVGSLLLSSVKYSSAFGILVLIAMVTTVVLWRGQFPSTWCFFAAVLSCMVSLIVWTEVKAPPPPAPDDNALEAERAQEDVEVAEPKLTE